MHIEVISPVNQPYMYAQHEVQRELLFGKRQALSRLSYGNWKVPLFDYRYEHINKCA